MNFKFLVACAFSVLCISLLIREGVEIGHKNFAFKIVVPYNDRITKSFDFFWFEVDTEEGEQLWLDALSRGYFTNKSGNYKHLFCWPLDQVYVGQNEIKLAKLGEDLVDYLNSSFYSHQISSLTAEEMPEEKIAKNLKLFNLFVLDSIRSKDYYVYMDQFCAVIDYFFYFDTLKKAFNRSTVYSVTKDRYDFFEIPPGHNSIQIHAYIKESKLPPEQQCTEERTEFGCLNRCFREKSRLTKYLYGANETGSVFLQTDPQADPVSIREHEIDCFERCKENDCNLRFVSGRLKNLPFKLVYIPATMNYFKIISPFSFVVQFLGLILSFWGTSFNKLSFRFVKIFCGKMNRKLLLALKIVVVLIFLAVFLLLSYKVLLNYQFRVENPSNNLKKNLLFEPEPINLVICVSVPYILGNPSVQHIQSLSFSELETKTAAAFDRTVEGIYLEMQDEHLNVTWRVRKEKVLFFNVNGALSRCFQLDEINIVQPRYESFLASSELVVSFAHEHYSLFMLVRNETFNSKSDVVSDYHKAKWVVKRLNTSKSPCEERSESQANSIDRCIHERSIAQNLNISFNFVIDKDLFSEHQWKTRFPASVAEHRQIEEKCRQEFQLSDCSFSYYVDSKMESLSKKPDKRKAYIVPIMIVLFNSDEIPTFYSFILELLNIAAILFDVNIMQLLLMFFIFFKFNRESKKPDRKRWYVLGVCSAGFIAHIYFIIRQINESNVIVGAFEEYPPFRVPEILFCFEFNRSLADNEQLTGNHLESITSELRVETIFDKIVYLNKQKQWVKLDVQSNFSNQDFRIQTVYFQNMKCFRVEQTVAYLKEQFDMRVSEHSLLRIAFNRTLIKQQEFYFYSKLQDEPDLSPRSNLNYRTEPNLTYAVSLTTRHGRGAKFETLESISNLFPLFKTNQFESVKEYLKSLKDRFKNEHNSTTLRLPLEREEFALKINDSLFRRFYYEHQYASDQATPADHMYKRSIVWNFVSEKEADQTQEQEVHFEFFMNRLAFWKLNQSMTKEDNW